MQKFRFLLLPFSWIYATVVFLRNALYDAGVLKSFRPDIKTIVIGNLALGGTGKTPHVSYILQMLKDKNVAVLSRGYGRKTKGTLIVKANSLPGEVGDEPLQMALNFPEVPVVVDENRLRGVAFIKASFPDTELVLLDDALQHRKLKAGFNLLLTTWSEPFFKQQYLPFGKLRDHKVRAKDAEAIVVTKIPEDADVETKNAFRKRLSKFTTNVFFDAIHYGSIVPVSDNTVKEIDSFEQVIVVTGIANPDFFIEKVQSQYTIARHFKYPDHHPFTTSNVDRFRNFIGRFAPGEIALLTTEKDAMRLKSLIANMSHETFPAYYWKIDVDFGADKASFDKLIEKYVARA